MAGSDSGYRHRFSDGTDTGYDTGKAVCVGRNYADHAREMGDAVPAEPVLFTKPTTAFVAMDEPIRMDTSLGTWHYELELAFLIGRGLSRCRPDEVAEGVAGLGLAFDLTLRDRQKALKAAGEPWDTAKGFDGSLALSPFVSTDPREWRSLSFELNRNGQVAQRGDSGDMVFGPEALISHITAFFTLLPGDVVLTGTPAGVGPLADGDRLEARLEDRLTITTTATER